MSGDVFVFFLERLEVLCETTFPIKNFLLSAWWVRRRVCESRCKIKKLARAGGKGRGKRSDGSLVVLSSAQCAARARRKKNVTPLTPRAEARSREKVFLVFGYFFFEARAGEATLTQRGHLHGRSSASCSSLWSPRQIQHISSSAAAEVEEG